MIRRHQGATGEARTLLARLRDDAQRALDSAKTKRLGPDEALTSAGMITWAEVVARNLGRPERSDRSGPPGTPGGPPRIDAPYQARSPVADGRIEPGEYGDGDGVSFDFVQGPQPRRLLSHRRRKTLAPGIKDPSDLSVRMHAVHTATALFLAFRVRDQSVQADPVAANVPWKNDCVEVYLDGDRMPNDLTPVSDMSGNLEGFQIIADALGNQFSGDLPTSGTRLEGGHEPHRGRVRDRVRDPARPDRHPGRARVPARDDRLGAADEREHPRLSTSRRTSQTFYGVLWSEDRQWSPPHGGEDFWPVALRLTPAPALTASGTMSPLSARRGSKRLGRCRGQARLGEELIHRR